MAITDGFEPSLLVISVRTASEPIREARTRSKADAAPPRCTFLFISLYV